MRLRGSRALCRSLLLVCLLAALAPGRAAAQACPLESYCFYVPPGLPLEGSHSTASSHSFDIVLSSPARTVNASYSIAGGPLVPITISPGSSERIALTATSGPASAYGVAEQNGVFLIADSPNLTVDHREVFDQEQYSETIKHSAIALGSRFRLAGYSLNLEEFASAGVDAVIIYAPTGATIELTAPPGVSLPFWSGTDGATYSATLTAGQTLAVRTLVGRDIDGALLTSSAPVAASSGGRGWSEDECGDDGMDGLVPTSALGREHVVRLSTGSSALGDESRVRVIADVAGTVVRVNGTQVATLGPGELYSFAPTALSYVQTSQPALVWMNGSLNGCELDTVLIPPIAFAPALTELSLDFNVLASSQVPSAELAILIVQSEVASILLDGSAPAVLSSEAVPGRPDLSYVRFNVSPGDHNVRAGADFQAMLATRTEPSGLLAYYNPYRIPGCGDGALDPGEACDDGDLIDGDGCSQSCTVEPGYGCSGAPSVCATLCGNGSITPPLETCDDGNGVAGDGCNRTCRREVTIAAPLAGSVVTLATPSVTGSADPGASITVALRGSSATIAANAQGAWSFLPAAALDDGPLTLVVTATDVRGGVSMATRTLSLDSRTFLTVAEPAAGVFLADATPSIAGTGEPGATVAVSLDGAAAETALVGADGSWELMPSAALAEGARTLSAIATDAAGNTASFGPLSFVVDTETFVVIAEPAANTTVPQAAPTVAGSAEPGATVELILDGSSLDLLTADGDGQWRTTAAPALERGLHTATARAQDAAGNQASYTIDFWIDARTGPLLLIHNLADGAFTSDPNPLFSGAADPGALVIASIDGVALDALVASARGGWSVRLFDPLAPGVHTLRAETSDAQGRTLADEHRFTFDEETSAVGIETPGAGGVVSSATPTISGTAAPGARVALQFDGEAPLELSAAADGSWSFEAPAALADGPHSVRVSATDGAQHAGSVEIGFYVDTQTSVAIRLPAAGAALGSALPSFAGHAERGAVVSIAIDQVNVGEVDVAPDGSWIFTLREPLAPGSHSITVHAMDQLGNLGEDGRAFIYDDSAPDSDGDGRSDAEECPSGPCPDSDDDGQSDELDADDDGDGLSTALECSVFPCRDGDGDGRPDYLDADDDGDGRPTLEEIAAPDTPRDTDYDRIADHLDVDDDGDGAPTASECMTAPCPDTDEDTLPDWLDPDDDNDRVPSVRERADSARLSNDDFDADRVVNWLDPDANDNGVDDGTDGTSDLDADEIPDYLDGDAVATIDPVTDPLDDGYRAAGGGGCSAARGDGGGASFMLLLLLLRLRASRRALRREPGAVAAGARRDVARCSALRICVARTRSILAASTAATCTASRIYCRRDTIGNAYMEAARPRSQRAATGADHQHPRPILVAEQGVE